MGAGCYYTHDTIGQYGNRKRAFWVEVPYYEDEADNEFAYPETKESIIAVLDEIGYAGGQNGLYKIDLESTYYGDGIVVKLEDKFEDSTCPSDIKLSNLAQANHEVHYDRIITALKESGLELRIATSGYTSMAI